MASQKLRPKASLSSSDSFCRWERRLANIAAVVALLLLVGCSFGLQKVPQLADQTVAQVSSLGGGEPASYLWILPLTGSLCILAAVAGICFNLKAEALLVGGTGITLILIGTTVSYIFANAGWLIVVGFGLFMAMALALVCYLSVKKVLHLKELNETEDVLSAIASLSQASFDELQAKLPLDWNDYFRTERQKHLLTTSTADYK